MLDQNKIKTLQSIILKELETLPRDNLRYYYLKDIYEDLEKMLEGDR